MHDSVAYQQVHGHGISGTSRAQASTVQDLGIGSFKIGFAVAEGSGNNLGQLRIGGASAISHPLFEVVARGFRLPSRASGACRY